MFYTPGVPAFVSDLFCLLAKCRYATNIGVLILNKWIMSESGFE